MRRGNGAIRMGVACALLFASLSLVIWRQSRALDELRGLDAARAERAQLQAERSALQREIQQLESRPRILAVASERLGMRVPTHSEIVFLQSPHAELQPAGVPTRPVVRGDDVRGDDTGPTVTGVTAVTVATAAEVH